MAKRRGKGVRYAEKKSGSQLLKKESEKANPLTAFTAIALLRQLSHAVWQRHRGVKLMLPQLSLWIFMLLFYLSHAWSSKDQLPYLDCLKLKSPYPWRRVKTQGIAQGSRRWEGRAAEKTSSLRSAILSQKELHGSLNGRRCSMVCAGLSVTTQLHTHNKRLHPPYW